jgi:pilus assembly protein CpaE
MKEKILIVDDDADALRLMSYTLRLEGYEIVTAESGTQAITAVERERPSLVVLDIMMPDMSGTEVCRRLRSAAQTATLPILILSAKTQVQDKVAAFKGGADDYVTKPAEPSEFVARVESLLLRASRGAAPSQPAQTLAFVGAKGGVGTTTVAVNLAVALAQLGTTVILVDLHPYLGCVGPMLGLEPVHGLQELAQMAASSILPRVVEKQLSSHPSGLRVLTSNCGLPPAGDGELDPAQAQAIVEGLVTLADWVLFDLPVDWTPAVSAVLDRSDRVVVVSEPDSLALRCAKRQLALLQQSRIAGEQVGAIIVNRSAASMTMTVTRLQDQLGTTIVGALPPAADPCLHALSLSVPLLLAAPDHFAAEMLRAMAQRLVQAPAQRSAAATAPRVPGGVGTARPQRDAARPEGTKTQSPSTGPKIATKV